MTKIPDKWFGEEIKGSLDKLLREPSSQVPSSRNPVNVPNMAGYIYVPSIDLLVAKERTHFNENWAQAHESLKQEDSFMLNMYEFVEFLKYLKENPNQENNQLFESITAVKDSYRGEWIDAKFQPSEIVYHKTNGNDRMQVVQPFEKFLGEDKTPGINLDEWVKNHNSQGLPNPEISQGDLYYYKPRSGYVARFGANSVGAGLYCCGDPDYTDPGLGVRGAKIKSLRKK